VAILLSQMMAKTKIVNVKYQGDNLDVTYRVNIVTPAFSSELQDKSGIEWLTEQVLRVVDKWDLLDSVGIPLPVIRENVIGLPTTFLQAVLAGIVDDMRAPGADEKKG
jgi:hypothetical protein